jgi:hypothetical protein
MPERRLADEDLGRVLRAVGRELALPPTPALAPSVTSRLLTERAGGRTRPFPGLALWTRRRTLALAAAGLVALLSLAAAARLVIGAVEIRVQPPVAPSATLPPVEPETLGVPVALGDVEAVTGLEPGLPAGPRPDAAYAIEGPNREAGVVFGWRPSERYPVLDGTGWGLLLMVFDSDAESIVKTVTAFEDTVDVVVNGERGYWITTPHRIVVETGRGPVELVATGHVLIWQAGDLTYRLETTLDRSAALELAHSVG